MLSIGEFARLAGVSVRMLRHYDQLDLLVPHHVDPHTGYRSYVVAQLDRANHLVALRELGFGLEQVAELLADDLTTDRLVAMLRARQAELQARIAVDHERLARVSAQLSTVIEEHTVSRRTFTETALPALRLAQLSTSVADVSAVGAEMGPLFGRVGELFAAADRPRRGPAVAHYTDGPDDHLVVGVAEQVDAPVAGLDDRELAAVDRALTTVLDAPDLSGIQAAWQALHTEIAARDLAARGTARELYHETPHDGGTRWRVELQQPVG